MKNVHLHTLAAAVDRLGTLKALAADICDESEILKGELILAGVPAVDGLLFRATVSHCPGRESVDWKAFGCTPGGLIMKPEDLQNLALAALTAPAPAQYDGVRDALRDCHNAPNPLHELADIAAENIRADECRFACEVIAGFCGYEITAPVRLNATAGDPVEKPEPVPTIDRETLREIVLSMKSASARLKGQRSDFSDGRAADCLDYAREQLCDAFDICYVNP